MKGNDGNGRMATAKFEPWTHKADGCLPCLFSTPPLVNQLEKVLPNLDLVVKVFGDL